MQNAMNPESADELREIRGFLVEFPLTFLNMDKLPPIPTLSVSYKQLVCLPSLGVHIAECTRVHNVHNKKYASEVVNKDN